MMLVDECLVCEHCVCPGCGIGVLMMELGMSLVDECLV